MIPRHIKALARVLFGRLFENDVFSSSVAASSSVLWLLAFLAVPGVMFSGGQLFAYAHLRHQPFAVIDRTLLQRETFHIDFVMGVAGLITMMVWSSLTPDRRDAHVLGTLPITSREQAFGRLLALFTFFGLFITAMAVPTGIAHPFVTVGAENIVELPATHSRAHRRRDLRRRLRLFRPRERAVDARGAVRTGRGAVRDVPAADVGDGRHDHRLDLVGIDDQRAARARDRCRRRDLVEPGGVVCRHLSMGGRRRSAGVCDAGRARSDGRARRDAADGDHVSARLRAMPAQRDRQRRTTNHGDVARVGDARGALAASAVTEAVAAGTRAHS